MSRINTMYQYLSEKTPDYVGLLSVAPQKIQVEGIKAIQVNKGYGISEQRIILSPNSVYNVQLIWDTYIDLSDVDTIFDFYHDQNKACGMLNSFYWKSPAQYGGLTYVAKFNSDLSEFISNFEVYDVTNLSLWVFGKKL